MTFEDLEYPELVRFLLILSVNADFRSAFLNECRTRDERFNFLRQHLFDPSLIFRDLNEYCSNNVHNLNDHFSEFLADLSESESLSDTLSRFSAQKMRSFVQNILQTSCLPSDPNTGVSGRLDSSILSTCHASSCTSKATVLDALDDSNSSFLSDQSVSSPICNICGSRKFSTFGKNDRPFAQCCSCQSLERHRALQLTLNQLGLLNPDFKGNRRCLHLAPELCTYRYLLDVYGAGYLVSDPCPDFYSGASCLKLSFPSDFLSFPSGFFDLIIHNHVLEHLPGSYLDHINHFYRLLSPDGYMVFTFPDLFYQFGLPSIEGGETFSSDVERLRLFGQKDHYKWLGVDFVSYLYSTFSSVELHCDPRTLDGYSQMKAHNAVGIVFACRK